MTRPSALIVLALGLVACSKPVDPAYMAAITDATTRVCACSTAPLDTRVECMGDARKQGTVHPKEGPGGEAPGLYENSLDDESRSKIDFARAAASSCEAAIMAGS